MSALLRCRTRPGVSRHRIAGVLQVPRILLGLAPSAGVVSMATKALLGDRHLAGHLKRTVELARDFGSLAFQARSDGRGLA